MGGKRGSEGSWKKKGADDSLPPGIKRKTVRYHEINTTAF